jgi:PAS domain S-box-containing protein
MPGDAPTTSRSQIEQLFELSNDLLGTASFDGFFTQLNQAWERCLGYTREELMARPYAELIHPDDLESTAAAAGTLGSGPSEVVNFANRFRAKDGSFRWLLWSSHSDGKMIYAVAKDITERKHTEEALAQRELSYRLLLEGVTDYAVFMLDPKGHVATWNRGAERIKGYSADEIIGRHFSAFYTPEAIAARHPEHELELAVSEGRYEEEGVRLRKDGTPIVVHVTITPIRSESGDLRGFAKVTQDISTRKEAEAELRAAREEAERANRAKSDFLSSMSHELRTPLNAILGFAQVLGLDELSASQHDDIEQILKGGRHLLDLINEILDIARIEGGRLNISPEPVLVADVVAEIVSLMRPLADERDIRLDADLPEMQDCHVIADRQRLAQVLLNLVSNTVKYNVEGGTVKVDCSAGSDETMRIAVTDTGPGIAPDQVPLLFTPFERLGADESGIEGTGLGLALSKSLVELMDGRLLVDSVPGHGATFWVELPAVDAPGIENRAPSDPDRPAVSAPPATRNTAGTLLYIEDNLSNLRLVETLLKRRPNVNLLSAMTAGLGLDFARDHAPDLVLLDLQLPDESGDKVLLRLQKDPRTAQIPVVILSADATPGQLERLIAAGAADYITKPIEVRRFLELVDDYLDQPDD